MVDHHGIKNCLLDPRLGGSKAKTVELIENYVWGFLKIYLNNLYTQHGAQTHDPDQNQESHVCSSDLAGQVPCGLCFNGMTG